MEALHAGGDLHALTSKVLEGTGNANQSCRKADAPRDAEHAGEDAPAATSPRCIDTKALELGEFSLRFADAVRNWRRASAEPPDNACPKRSVIRTRWHPPSR